MALVITKQQRHWITGLAVVVLLALTATFVTQRGGGDSPTAEDELPNTSFALFDGGDATFDSFAGTPLVINFWASWCPACVAELPEFQAAHEEYSDDVVFLGLANADDRNAALELADEVGLTYELGDDPRGDLFRELELIAMPSTIFVTADGEILEVFGGQLTGPALADRLDDLIEAS